MAVELRRRFGSDRFDDRRAEIDADIRRLVGRENARLRIFDTPGADFFKGASSDELTYELTPTALTPKAR